MIHSIGGGKALVYSLFLTGLAFFGWSSQAAVTLARNGQSDAVIVHNGHTGHPEQPASYARMAPRTYVESLRHYIQQITGAELVLVGSLAEAGDRPANIDSA